MEKSSGMYRKLNQFFDQYQAYGAIFIRVLLGFHLIYGVQDNVLSWDRMLEFEAFLAQHGFPIPLYCAVLSVYAQLICGVLFILGAFVRAAALVMIFNFIVALMMVHIGDAYPSVFPALAMLLGSAFLLFNGAGAWSFDTNK